MASAAAVITFIALAGALASFIAGAWFAAQVLGRAETRWRWLAAAAWPLAMTRLRAAAGDEAARLNKALVACIACLLVAGAAWSAASNLYRVAR